MELSQAVGLLDRILEHNRHYVSRDSATGPANPVPADRLALLTCMDVRIDPLALLGLELGQAHILRNAGARVTDDVLRSLVISQQALGTEMVILMPHTGCGVLGLDPHSLREHAHPNPASLPPMEFFAMQNIETTLREDLGRIRNNPWIPATIRLSGVILDIESGLVQPVYPPH